MEERILTPHSEGRAGVNISRAKYDQVRSCIIESPVHGDKTYTQLAQDVEASVSSNFDGPVRWHTEVVKLNLEALGVVERLHKTRPQLLRLANEETFN